MRATIGKPCVIGDVAQFSGWETRRGCAALQRSLADKPLFNVGLDPKGVW